MNLRAFIVCVVLAPALWAQQTPELKLPSDFYPAEKTQVLLVGTFHFNFPGLDEIKTRKEDQIDVLEDPWKAEVTRLATYLKAFRPNKIALEARNDNELNQEFQQYRNGAFREKRSEVYQLGMRIADDLDHQRVYAIDAGSVNNDIYQKDSSLYRSLFDKIDRTSEDPYWKYAESYFDYRDRMLSNVSLLDYFTHLNLPEVQRANYGLYLTGSFATGDGQGADHLSMWWYNRNLRIFANLINLTQGPEDRIMVIIGNGHAAVLRELFEASPQFELIEFDTLVQD
jgi:hypothetical protein